MSTRNHRVEDWIEAMKRHRLAASQADCALAIGITPDHLSRVKHGRQPLTPTLWQAMLGAYRLPPIE